MIINLHCIKDINIEVRWWKQNSWFPEEQCNYKDVFVISWDKQIFFFAFEFYPTGQLATMKTLPRKRLNGQ